MIRNVPGEAVARFRAAARARNMQQGDFLARLITLHDAVRAAADAGDDGLQAALESLGLQTISH
jgi:hypothetical protein